MKPGEGPDPERLFSIFLDLVRLDSESGKEGPVSGYIKEFCSRLGLNEIEDEAGEATGGECGNLIVKVPCDGLPGPPIIINAHMDTVAPGIGVVVEDGGDRFVSRGDTVLGADCKAGVAAILAAVEALREDGDEHRSLELVFTVQEEIGLVGASHLDTSLLAGEWGVVLDGSGPVGGIVVEAPGQDQVKFTLRGRAAHAGVEPEKGVSAIACAAMAIAGLRLGRHDEETTSNIGLISGGNAVNIVPELAVVEGEIRSLSASRLAEEGEAMLDVFRRAAGKCGCLLDAQVWRQFEHFRLDERSRPVMHLKRAMESCGVEPYLATSGGGSDANVLNLAGLQMAVMHIGLVDAHSKEERILKADLVTVARVVAELARQSIDIEREARC